jgi:hypothetical protein
MFDLRKTPNQATVSSQTFKRIQDVRGERPVSMIHPAKESTLCLLVRALVFSCLSPGTLRVSTVEFLKIFQSFCP